MAPVTSVFVSVQQALEDMISSLQTAGSPITDFTTGSVSRSLLEAFATVVSNQSQAADQLQQDCYLDTATGAALDALGANNWQVPRNPAVQATGQVTITRQSTASALVLPAGFTQLVATPSVPGTPGVGVLTTQDASFSAGQASVTVSAQAVLGGSAGNLSTGVYLTPMQPVGGISSQNGFEVTTAFSNGVDAESDDAYRARIPLTVQGRVKGRVAAFQAAALGVPGVLSAGVLTAGARRGDGTSVPVNAVEVYYQGSTGLLSAVTSAVSSAATANQNPSTFASISLSAPRGQQRVVAGVTVYCLSGTDTTALAASVTSALQSYVNGVGIGGTVYYSLAAQAIQQVPGVVSVALPLAQLSLYGGSGAQNLAMAGDSYPNLAAADVLVAVNTLS